MTFKKYPEACHKMDHLGMDHVKQPIFLLHIIQFYSSSTAFLHSSLQYISSSLAPVNLFPGYTCCGYQHHGNCDSDDWGPNWSMNIHESSNTQVFLTQAPSSAVLHFEDVGHKHAAQRRKHCHGSPVLSQSQFHVVQAQGINWSTSGHTIPLAQSPKPHKNIVGIECLL